MRLKPNSLHFWKSICWAIIIFIISAVPGQDVPELPFRNFDKLVHAALYFCLAVIFYFDLKKITGVGFSFRQAFAVVFAWSVGYGGMLELLQAFVFIHRSGSWFDFMANTVGVIAAGVWVKAVAPGLRRAKEA